MTVFDTHEKNRPSDKTETPAKSMNMYIWPISVLNQLFIQVSYTQLKLKKKKKRISSQWKKSIFGNGPISYFPFSLS